MKLVHMTKTQTTTICGLDAQKHSFTATGDVKKVACKKCLLVHNMLERKNAKQKGNTRG